MTGDSAEIKQHEPDAKAALFGFHFDSVTLAKATQRVLDLVDTQGTGHYVVTPNVDHAVTLSRRPELAEVYDAAALVVADGLPIIWASRWLGKALPERVAGSDLVPAVFEAAQRRLNVYLLGARPGVAQKAAAEIESRFPNIRVVGTQSPPVGFENDPRTNDEAVKLVADAAPDILILGLGAPKQELWAFRERHRLGAKVILCAGATIDFLAGERVRAPQWCQRFGLEWAYRALEEPKRMVPRYAADIAIFPQLIAKEWLRVARP